MNEDEIPSCGAAPLDAELTHMERIKKRPGMYLGSKSLTAFWHFLGGFQMACGIHKIEDDGLGLDMPRDFDEWVAYRTRFQESTRGWCKMIVATSNSEEESFDRFFELLEESKTRVPRLVAEVIGPVSNCTTSIGMGPSFTIPPPEKVRLVTYTDDPGFFIHHGSENWRDRFCPYLSWIWMRGWSGGEWVIHDEAAYRELIRENEANERELNGSLAGEGEEVGATNSGQGRPPNA